MNHTRNLLVLALAAATGTLASAQRPGAGGADSGRRGGAVGPLEVHEPPAAAGIAWFGTWDGALAEAKRTGRPILFMSAAPQCQGVPGVW